MKIDVNKFNSILINNLISLDDLSKKANISTKTLTNIRNGKNIRLETAMKITKALGINAEDILLDETKED